MMNECLMSYENVSVTLGHQNVLSNISFKVHEGDFLNIVGPNGAGKTTLIKSLIGDIKVTEGTLKLKYEDIGYVPQKQVIKRHFPMTVFEFVYTGLRHQKLLIPKAVKEQILTLLNIMELDH